MPGKPGIRPVDPTESPGGAKRLLMKVSNSSAGRSIGIHLAANLDPWLLRVSGGRVATTAYFPLVTLIARGRKSGEERRTPLVYFTRGDEVILVASSFGREKHPAWYYNATAGPDVELMARGERIPYRVRETEGEEREQLLDLAEQLYPGYGAYRERTAGVREIPVLALSPR
jgi:deazaflavin-dependent oxidoreductase (nitroreductase family)